MIKVFWLFSLMTIFFASGSRSVSCTDFFEMSEQFPGAVIFDVRPADEYMESRIANAIYAGEKKVLLKQLSYLSDTTLIMVYCQYGDRSKSVLKILSQEGFNNAVHLQHGFEAWLKEGFPVDVLPIKRPEEGH